MQVAMYPKHSRDQFSHRVRLTFTNSEVNFLGAELGEKRVLIDGTAEDGMRVWLDDKSGQKLTALPGGRYWATTVDSKVIGVNPIRGRVHAFRVEGTLHSTATKRELKVKPFLSKMAEHSASPTLRNERDLRRTTNGSHRPTPIKENPFAAKRPEQPGLPLTQHNDALNQTRQNRIRRANTLLKEFNQAWLECGDVVKQFELETHENGFSIRQKLEPTQRLAELIRSLNETRKETKDVVLRVSGDGEVVALREVVTYEPLT